MLKFNYENTGIKEEQLVKYSSQITKLHNGLKAKEE